MKISTVLAVILAFLPCWIAECRQAAPPASALPGQAQQLLDRARQANPARYQFAMDRGAEVLATSDGRSFYLLWHPPGAAVGKTPLIATLHGSSSWAFDEFFLWYEAARGAGYGVLAFQWWFGAGEDNEAYYPNDVLHAELRAALRKTGIAEGTVLLHGFSRGSSNIYGVAALDRRAQDRFFGMVIANSGGASANFPPNVAISGGTYGYNILSGTYWTMYCGGRDPNPDRDGCPAMHRTAEWVGRYGGVLDLFLEDPEGVHGGFHQTPVHLQAALEAFRRNQDLRRIAPLPGTRWIVRPNPGFQISGGAASNAGLVKGEVWLTALVPDGTRLYRGADGASPPAGAVIPGLSEALSGTGFVPGEALPREMSNGRRALFAHGLGPPNSNRATLFRLFEGSDGKFARDPAAPVFTEEPFVGVPDVTPLPDGRHRLIYVALSSVQGNSRIAISSDGGASFTREFDNPFGDLAVPNPGPQDINVDPAVVRLSRGGYLGVAMRDKKLYLFTSIDGRSFVPSPTPAIEASSLSAGATGLFDPTLVELPDGRIFVYVTAEGDAGASTSRIVRAELARDTAPPAQSPAIASGGIRNAASATEILAPGAIISIYGSNLAAGEALAKGYPLPLELGGARVTVNGRPAPLFYASPSQINAQLPFETATGKATVEVSGARAEATIAAAAPGIFKLSGELAAVAPVAPGQVATIYLTGQGAVAPPVPTGAAAPLTPLSTVTQAVEVSIGGKKAEVHFAGLAPGFAGLMQLNLWVPDLPAGDHPVVVTIGQVASNVARLPVRAAAASLAAPVLTH